MERAIERIIRVLEDKNKDTVTLDEYLETTQRYADKLLNKVRTIAKELE